MSVSDGALHLNPARHCTFSVAVYRSEMQDFVKSVSGEENLPMVPEEQLDFTMKLYDLNQVGGQRLGAGGGVARGQGAFETQTAHFPGV